MRRREYYWSLYHSTEKNQIDTLRTDQVEAIFAALPKATHAQWSIWRDGFDGWKPFEHFPQLLLSLRKTDDRPAESPPPPPRFDENTGVIVFGSLGATEEDDVDDGTDSTDNDAVITFGSDVRPSIAPALPQDGTVVVKTGSVPKASASPGRKPGGSPRVEMPADISNTLLDSPESDLSLMQTGLGEDRSNYRFDKAFEVRITANDKTFKNETVNVSLKGIQLRDALPKGLPRYFNVEICQGKRIIPVVCSEIKPKDGKPSHRVRIEVNDYAPGLLAMLLSG